MRHKWQYQTLEELERSSPSRRDGIPLVKEKQLLKNTYDRIKTSGERMQLLAKTMSTAMVFVHRFFSKRSLRKTDHMVLGMAALFLACKVEDEPRSLQDVITIYFAHVQKAAAKKKVVSQPSRLKEPEFFGKLREAVLQAERSLMYTLGFGFQVDHYFEPFQSTGLKYNLHMIHPRLLNFAYTMYGESYRLSLCLQYPMKHVAVACMQYAMTFWQQKSGMEVTTPLLNGKPWFEDVGLTTAQMDDLQSQLLAQYNTIAVPPVKFTEGAATEGARAGAPAPTEAANGGGEKAAPSSDAAQEDKQAAGEAEPELDQHAVSTPVQLCESGELPPMDVSGH